MKPPTSQIQICSQGAGNHPMPQMIAQGPAQDQAQPTIETLEVEKPEEAHCSEAQKQGEVLSLEAQRQGEVLCLAVPRVISALRGAKAREHAP